MTRGQYETISELLKELNWTRDIMVEHVGEQYRDWEDLDYFDAAELIKKMKAIERHYAEFEGWA